MELVTKELALADDVTFSTKVVFGVSKIKLDDTEVERVLFNGMDDRVDTLLLTVDKLV